MTEDTNSNSFRSSLPSKFNPSPPSFAPPKPSGYVVDTPTGKVSIPSQTATQQEKATGTPVYSSGGGGSYSSPQAAQGQTSMITSQVVAEQKQKVEDKGQTIAPSKTTISAVNQPLTDTRQVNPSEGLTTWGRVKYGLSQYGTPEFRENIKSDLNTLNIKKFFVDISTPLAISISPKVRGEMIESPGQTITKGTGIYSPATNQYEAWKVEQPKTGYQLASEGALLGKERLSRKALTEPIATTPIAATAETLTRIFPPTAIPLGVTEVNLGVGTKDYKTAAIGTITAVGGIYTQTAISARAVTAARVEALTQGRNINLGYRVIGKDSFVDVSRSSVSYDFGTYTTSTKAVTKLNPELQTFQTTAKTTSNMVVRDFWTGKNLVGGNVNVVQAKGVYAPIKNDWVLSLSKSTTRIIGEYSLSGANTLRGTIKVYPRGKLVESNMPYSALGTGKEKAVVGISGKVNTFVVEKTPYTSEFKSLSFEGGQITLLKKISPSNIPSIEYTGGTTKTITSQITPITSTAKGLAPQITLKSASSSLISGASVSGFTAKQAPESLTYSATKQIQSREIAPAITGRTIITIETKQIKAVTPISSTSGLIYVSPKQQFKDLIAPITIQEIGQTVIPGKKLIPGLTSVPASFITATPYIPSIATPPITPSFAWFPKGGLDVGVPSNIIKGGKKVVGYQPSFRAFVFREFGEYKPTKLSKTGLDYRPITSKWSISKRRGSLKLI